MAGYAHPLPKSGPAEIRQNCREAASVTFNILSDTRVRAGGIRIDCSRAIPTLSILKTNGNNPDFAVWTLGVITVDSALFDATREQTPHLAGGDPGDTLKRDRRIFMVTGIKTRSRSWQVGRK